MCRRIFPLPASPFFGTAHQVGGRSICCFFAGFSSGEFLSNLINRNPTLLKPAADHRNSEQLSHRELLHREKFFQEKASMAAFSIEILEIEQPSQAEQRLRTEAVAREADPEGDCPIPAGEALSGARDR